MARWLPLHRDRYFQSLQAAAHGGYRPQYPDKPRPAEPQAARAAANREMDAFSRRADAAMRAYQAKKRR